ncbi:hypothetical protein IFM89_019746 [Coptis chinensis]|uniref:Uncharacterized protein n=1 Tax=Coptis chinensis TaxID=261450 RepID=A0A835LIL0_9MAGN|nr:hypothetical protein IFM89_019746 [Coptis chinensis]
MHNNGITIGSLLVDEIMNFHQSQPWKSIAYYPCSEEPSQVYFNLPKVQKALHANVTGIPYPWKRCR